MGHCSVICTSSLIDTLQIIKALAMKIFGPSGII